MFENMIYLSSLVLVHSLPLPFHKSYLTLILNDAYVAKFDKPAGSYFIWYLYRIYRSFLTSLMLLSPSFTPLIFDSFSFFSS